MLKSSILPLGQAPAGAARRANTLSMWQRVIRRFDGFVPLAESWDQHRHFFTILYVVVPENLHEITLLVANGDQDISCLLRITNYAGNPPTIL